MGKILFTSYEDALTLDLSKYDLKLQIVRFTGKGLLKDFIHVPQLSPSKRLFREALYKWKKLRFTKEELSFLSTGDTGTWFDIYKLCFLKELGRNINSDLDFIKQTKENPILLLNYNRLKEHLDNNKNIIAICYCDNYKKCHRYILGQELIKEGYEVYFG